METAVCHCQGVWEWELRLPMGKVSSRHVKHVVVPHFCLFTVDQHFCQLVRLVCHSQSHCYYYCIFNITLSFWFIWTTSPCMQFVVLSINRLDSYSSWAAFMVLSWKKNYECKMLTTAVCVINCIACTLKNLSATMCIWKKMRSKCSCPHCKSYTVKGDGFILQ